jgi:prepilin-type N-terminal cleavage/methylation domain-containing protein
MLTALRKRLEARDEKGFTLIELLVVIIIIGILLAIAVPSYLGFRDRAAKAAAQANVRSAIPAIETFFADNGTYVGVENPVVDDTAADPNGADDLEDGALSYDAGLNVSWGAAATQTATSYCVYSTVPTVGGFTFFKEGPSGAITEDAGVLRNDCDPAA